MQRHQALHDPDTAISAGLDSPATSAVEASRGERLEDARAADRLWREQRRLDVAREIRRIKRLYIPIGTLLATTAVWPVCMGFDYFVLRGNGFIYRTTGVPENLAAELSLLASIALYLLGLGFGNSLVLERMLRWRERLERELAEYEDPAASSTF